MATVVPPRQLMPVLRHLIRQTIMGHVILPLMLAGPPIKALSSAMAPVAPLRRLIRRTMAMSAILPPTLAGRQIRELYNVTVLVARNSPRPIRQITGIPAREARTPAAYAMWELSVALAPAPQSLLPNQVALI